MIAVRVRSGGHVVREQVFASGPVTFGRAPEVDVILADDSVSHRHACLERDPEDGAWVLHDLGSRNGVHRGPQVVTTLRIDASTRCRLGRAEVELEPVPDTPTLELSPAELRVFDQRRGLGHHVVSLGLGVCGGLAASAVSPGFWSPWNDERVPTLLSLAVGLAIALPLLAGTLLVALRATGRRVRLADTLRAVAWLAWLWPAATIASYLAYYVLPRGARAAVEGALSSGIVVYSVVHLAGLRRGGSGRLFRLAWATGVLLLLAGAWGSARLGMRTMGMPQTSYAVQPPLAGLTGPTRDLQDYLARVQARGKAAALEAEETAAADAGD